MGHTHLRSDITNFTHDHTEDSGWIVPTLLNGWVNWSPTSGGAWNQAGYRKLNGVGYLKGLIRAGTTTAGTVFFNLAVGYRPVGDMHVAVASAGAFAIINIMSNGDVKANTNISNVWVSLDGISFPADN
jgi:hypothetical protein